MRLALLLTFLAVPLLELALLVKLSQWIGFWPTVALVVATAVIGITVMQRQGMAALGRAMAAMASGRPPIEPVLDGALLMLAGGLLLAPGLLTDLAGALLLIPPVRRAVATWCFGRGTGWVDVEGSERRRSEPQERQNTARDSAGGQVIDGEYTRVDEHTIDPDRDRRG